MEEGSSRHILVVEDEPVIASLLADVLTSAGHRVTICGTVAEGIVAARVHDDLALCVSDFLLPDRTGLDLARELRRMRPELRVVLASAFLESDIEEQVAHEPTIAMIVRKPVDIFELRDRIAALLAQQRPDDGAAEREAAC